MFHLHSSAPRSVDPELAQPEPVPPRARQQPASRRLLGALLAGGVAASMLLVSPTAAEAAPKAPKAPKVHTVGVGSNPYAIAISQSLGKAFVVDDGGVSVVSLLTHRNLGEFSTNGYQGQNGITLVRGETQGWVTNGTKKSVVAFDTETHKVIRQIQVGDYSQDIVTANTPKGQRAYVALVRQKQLVAIDTKTAKVVQRVKVPGVVGSLAARPGGKTIYAGSIQQNRVWVVNTSTGKITRTIKTDRSGPPTTIAFTPNAKRAWVTGLGGVSVINTTTGKVIKYIEAPVMFPGISNPQAVAFSGSGRYAFVTNGSFPDAPARSQVAMVDTRTYRRVWRVTTGVGSYSIGLDNHRHTAYVPNYYDDTVSYLHIPC